MRIMTKATIRVAVTGAAGQISYSLLFRIASGGMFGPDRPVSLSLLELRPAQPLLEALMMELDDCAFPLLTGVKAGYDAAEAFEGLTGSSSSAARLTRRGSRARSCCGPMP